MYQDSETSTGTVLAAGGTIFGAYEYDGLNRRIRDASGVGIEYYYSLSWQLIAVRDGPTEGDDDTSADGTPDTTTAGAQRCIGDIACTSMIVAQV